MKTHLIIPARYASSRLKAKPLLAIHSKPMILWTADRAKQVVADGIADDYWVATDNDEIFGLCQENNIPCVMTDESHPSGTDRLGQVVRLLDFDDNDIVLNLQGDEPLAPVALFVQLKALLLEKPDCVMATLCEPIVDNEEFFRNSVVKVVFNQHNEALYFSRSPIPYHRENPEFAKNAYRHLGIYGYRVSLLKSFSSWQLGVLEKLESLEQLRILENGQKIAIAIACVNLPAGVDTQSDLDRLNQMELTELLNIING